MTLQCCFIKDLIGGAGNLLENYNLYYFSVMEKCIKFSFNLAHLFSRLITALFYVVDLVSHNIEIVLNWKTNMEAVIKIIEENIPEVRYSGCFWYCSVED